MAAGWFEYEYEPDEFTVGDVSVFLSPFDREEWTSFDGDIWKQTRTTRTSDDSGGFRLESFDVFDNPPVHIESPMLDWLEAGLGAPSLGMKWVGTHYGVLQVPTGWRVVSDSLAEHIEWSPQQGIILLRLSRFQREAETPHKRRTTSAARPISIDHEVLTDAEWMQDRWSLVYGDGDEEIMLMLSLYSRPGGEAFHGNIRDQIAAAIHRTYYVPPTSVWDTSTVD